MISNEDSPYEGDSESVEGPEWEIVLEGYRASRDTFLYHTRKFWQLPTAEKYYLADEARSNLMSTLQHMVTNALFDQEELDMESKLQLVGGIGRMCDEDMVSGLNSIAGTQEFDRLFGDADHIKFVTSDDAEQDELESGIMNYLNVVVMKLEHDFDVFCELPHFDKIDKLRQIGRHTLDVAKIGGGVALGLALYDKLRKS